MSQSVFGSIFPPDPIATIGPWPALPVSAAESGRTFETFSLSPNTFPNINARGETTGIYEAAGQRSLNGPSEAAHSPPRQYLSTTKERGLWFP